MSISTNRKYGSIPSKVKISNPSYAPRKLISSRDQIECFGQNRIEVHVSDAEAQVIASKAKKAGLSLNEYLRYAALGFPIP